MNLLDYFDEQGSEIIANPLQIQKAYAYIRVSNEDSADRGTSLETQRRDIERMASRDEIQIVEWFVEPGKSAFKNDDKRTEFNRMIKQAIESIDISMIIVWKSDRFSRDRYGAGATKRDLMKKGIRVLSVLEHMIQLPYPVLFSNLSLMQ